MDLIDKTKRSGRTLAFSNIFSFQTVLNVFLFIRTSISAFTASSDCEFLERGPSELSTSVENVGIEFASRAAATVNESREFFSSAKNCYDS